MDIDRRDLTRLEDQPQGWGAWAKSWWGGGGKPKESKHDKDIIAQFEQAMTPEEKAKLYDAIDYQENIPPTDYPKTYVENRVRAGVNAVSLKVEETLELKFTQINALFEQRSSARAIK
jgi:vacuolar protein sorting-associated protein 13A/C